jgi:hypothetical protein
MGSIQRVMTRRTAAPMAVSVWLAICSALALCAGAAFSQTEATPQPLTPAPYRRTPDQTFLTFPEWFLVHSPAEYAAYLNDNRRPSGFPLFAHIGQFWDSYFAINQEIEAYPFNGGYHLMVMVIGVSTTVEYGLKGIYEHTIGRLAEATVSAVEMPATAVPEEQFAARYAKSYVDFIRVEPWYLFNFWQQLKMLWADAPPTHGANLVRRWERRYALTSELLVKEGYARLIKLGTQTAYTAPQPTTAIVINRMPVTDAVRWPDFHPLTATSPSAAGSPAYPLATVPRYEGFTRYSQWLAQQGIDFIEIAGNRGDVVVSVVAPTAWSAGSLRRLFEQPILTRPGTKRVVFAVPVASLASTLRSMRSTPMTIDKATATVEHVYDY